MSDPNKRRFHLLIVLAVLVGAIILLIAAERGSIVPTEPADDATTSGALDTPAAPQSTAATVAVYNGPTAVRAFGAQAIIPPAANGEPSPLADALNRRDRTADQDLEVVAELLASYQDFLHELPVGTNAEITAALAGDNVHGHAPLPANHPAINAAGELTDRWGTPFFFHQLAANRMEVRSAGPDRQMYGEDDFIWPRPSEQTWTTAAAALLGQPR